MLFRNLFPVLLNQDETPGGGAEVPAPVTPPAPASDAPWSQDLAGLGLAPEAQSAVDGYLRQNWQPRMTQFEQQVKELAPAGELWRDFHEDPAATFLAVGGQLFGEDKLSELEKLIAAQEEEAPAPAETQQLDPRVQALLDEREATARANAYREQLDNIKGQVPDLDEELFHPFVISAEGDMDKALTQYQQYLGRVEAKYKPAEEQPPPPPATLGADGQGTSVPAGATPPRYDSLDAALDATLAEMRASGTPAVGTV